MPEDMPERMPEDMPDKMPEDLPVTKCINVMVGITRSKVILSTFCTTIHAIFVYIYIYLKPTHKALSTFGVETNKKGSLGSRERGGI